MRRAWALVVIVGLGTTGFVADLLSSRTSRWFASHQFATAIAADLLLLGAAYLGIDHAISSTTARRWRRAAGPPLRQVLDAMVAVHHELERMLGSRHSSPSEPELERYEATVARYGPLMAATPELAEIYASVATHLSCAQRLVVIHRQQLVPSWDPVNALNVAAEDAVNAIGRYLQGPVVAPPEVCTRIPTIAEALRPNA
jgi:hypothetical protein